MQSGVYGVDLWLHTVAATIIQTVDTPAAALSFGIELMRCQTYASNSSTDLLTGMGQCLRLFSGSVPSDDIPLDVLSNHSSDFRANTLADADNLAVIVNPMVDVDMFTATTAGPFPNDTTASGSTTFMLSSDCEGCDHLDPGTYSNGLWEMLLDFDCGANCADQDAAARGQALAAQLKPPENRYSLWMQMLWEVTPKRVSDPSLSAPQDQGTYIGNGYYNTLLTDCTFNFYNVTLSYRNGNYTIVDETLSNPGLADGLAAPTRTGVINQQLMVDIQGMVLAEGSRPQDMQAYLEQDLARLAIGAATVVTYTQPLTTDNAVVSTRLAGRYPFWPCVLFIALLLVNGVFPLALGIAATLTRTERIAVSMKEGSGRSSVAVLELTKVRLTELTAVAAKLFHAPEGEARVDLDMKESVADMFDETPDEERVLVGLHERADGQVSFGL
ncbi:hypothetical protein EWM64_g2187 [Hericium alpestre]|uniref:Uncharacterized protein n=1 Tax=Hericium alpestre TaxID=135208 RepID=A0A4Z0A473_9AGAM|nr:hypothetical protein EWM64_g2187 [Hericium alpestre]